MYTFLISDESNSGNHLFIIFDDAQKLQTAKRAILMERFPTDVDPLQSDEEEERAAMRTVATVNFFFLNE